MDLRSLLSSSSCSYSCIHRIPNRTRIREESLLSENLTEKWVNCWNPKSLIRRQFIYAIVRDIEKHRYGWQLVDTAISSEAGDGN